MSKRNKTTLYAAALAEILASKTFDEKKVIRNFVKLLVAEGVENQSNKILDLAEAMMLKKRGNKKITFESARKLTSNQKKILFRIAETGDVVAEKINPELIAGVKVVINSEKQFDNSMLSKLNNIL